MNYRIECKLGAGAFGNVYTLQTDRYGKFALKTVNNLRLDRSEEECYTEGTLMLKLCHTHLVHCYDAFLYGTHLYLIMELCTHGSLDQFIQRRKSFVQESQICSWMAQLADVLRYLHAMKIIHRDLKPANIFLDAKENIKLGDLGVARELEHTVQERCTAVGTLYYMSPEVFSGLPYNYKTDVWSLGCCIHETMTLKKTFQGRSWTELHHMISTAQVPDMPSVYQPKLCTLVLSLLCKDSHHRPDALEILHVLFKIQGKRYSSTPFQPLTKATFDHKLICQALKTFENSSNNDKIIPLSAVCVNVDGMDYSQYPCEESKSSQCLSDSSSLAKFESESHSQTTPVMYMDKLSVESRHWLKERQKYGETDRKISPLKVSVESSDEEEEEEASGLVTLFTQSETAVFLHKKSSSVQQSMANRATS